MDSPYILPADAAEYLHVKPSTLMWWRSRGGGPRFHKIGARKVAYKQADLDDFVQARSVASERPARRRKAP